MFLIVQKPLYSSNLSDFSQCVVNASNYLPFADRFISLYNSKSSVAKV